MIVVYLYQWMVCARCQRRFRVRLRDAGGMPIYDPAQGKFCPDCPDERLRPEGEAK